MHAIIAFLAFIFSPTDDWTLKQAFELFIDPSEIPAVVEQVNRTAGKYPTVVRLGEKEISADSVNSALWSHILEKQNHTKLAHTAWKKSAGDPRAPAELVDQMQLKLGEAALADGDLSAAQNHFERILANADSPYRLDARIDLLIVALQREDMDAVKTQAGIIETHVGKQAPVKRALFPLGLASYATNDFAAANDYFAAMDNDPRGQYFQGLALRKLDRPRDALIAWQNLRQAGTDKYWSQLANTQVAETYFALGDDRLARGACEKVLESVEENGALKEIIDFRLASIDMREGEYDNALARLESLKEGELAQRSNILMAEAMIKTGRSADLYETLAREKGRGGAEKSYQTAWAALFEKKSEDSVSIAQTGLEKYFDAEYTPRLLLLQGLAFEHTGAEADALAAYQTVIDRFPQSHAAAQSTHWLTLAYLRLGRFREAVTHGSYAWSQLPEELKREHPDTAYWLAEAHLKLDRIDEADANFGKFLAMTKPDNKLLMNAQFQRSVTLAKLNRPAEALAMLDQFTKTANDRGQAQWVAYANLQRGNIYFNNKQYAEAVTAYRQGAGASKALFNGALALYKMEYYTDAAETWAKMGVERRQEKFGELASFRSARTLFELGRATDAVNSFMLFARAYPDSPLVKEARLQAGHALYNAGQIAEAAPYYADYLNRYRTTEDMVAATPYLAACYAHMGKSPMEADELMRGLPPTDVYAGIRWEKGAKDFNNKNFAEAEMLFAQLVTDAPTHENAGPARFYRGESAFTQGKWVDAESSFSSYLGSLDKTTDLQGSAPVALFHKGVSLYNQDKLLKAAGVFESMLNEYPEHPLAADAGQNLLICYHNLGDWNTRDLNREKYRIPNVEQTAPAAAQTTDEKPAGRGVHEVPAGSAPIMNAPREVAEATTTAPTTVQQ